MDTTTIAVDLAKYIFKIAVYHRTGIVSESHRLSKPKFKHFFAQHQPATVLLEACSSAHYWASKKSKNTDRLRLWTLEIERTRGHNKAAVALANKIARIAWVLWKNNRNFENTTKEVTA